MLQKSCIIRTLAKQKRSLQFTGDCAGNKNLIGQPDINMLGMKFLGEQKVAVGDNP